MDKNGVTTHADGSKDRMIHIDQVTQQTTDDVCMDPEHCDKQHFCEVLDYGDRSR
jgi:hypothetical protein